MSSTKDTIKFVHFCFYQYEIGEWDGEEEFATAQLNRMLETMDMILPEDVNISLCSAMRSKIWEDWGTNTRILDITKDEIMHYALASLKAYFNRSALTNAA